MPKDPGPYSERRQFWDNVKVGAGMGGLVEAMVTVSISTSPEETPLMFVSVLVLDTALVLSGVRSALRLSNVVEQDSNGSE